MLHGKEDTSVKVECQRNFYNKALGLYKNCPEKIKLIEYSRINHRTTVGMMENAVSFLKRFL